MGPVLPALVVPALVGFLLVGCKSDEEEVTETAPRSVPFEGKPDSALAGSYKIKDGTLYVLEKDGKFHFDGKTSTPQGVKATHGEGEWARNGQQLLFKDANAVVHYNFVQKGKDLTLSLTGKMKNETFFVRQ